ncbi:MAG: hypothetical protein JNJ83_18575 [Verrucomicrobiaceae bacterium]|nr:hypothetical protein [Verrucomicrobiaceae bacterium]
MAQSTLPNPTLLSIYPPAAKTAATATVTITGASLDGLLGLYFPVKGITSKPGAKANEILLTVDETVKPGFYDVRVVTRYGVSNPRGFYLTDRPLVELKSGGRLDQEQIGFGQAVKADRMTIAVNAKAGQKFSFSVHASGLDSRMEPRVSIRDSGNSIIGRFFEASPFALKSESDAVYTLDVQDMMFRGDVEHPFLLSLDGGIGLSKEIITDEVPGSLLPKSVRVDGSYKGRFPADSTFREFTFTAKKGEPKIIDVRSARAGELADPSFIIERLVGGKWVFIAEVADRKVLAGKEEFDDGAADPVYRLEATEDGEFRVRLRNNLSNQAAFELIVRPLGGSFELVALPADAPVAKKTATTVTHLPLWRGSTAAFKVYALRDIDYTGPVILTVDGLPPGVTAGPAIIGAGANVGWLTLTASNEAAPWAGSIKIKGNGSVIARGAVTVRATPNTAREPIYTRLTEDVVIGVSEAEGPVLVEPETAVVESKSADKVTVPFKLTRKGDFDAEVKVTALGIGDKTPPVLAFAAKAASGSLVLDLAKLKLGNGDHTIVFQGTAKFKHVSLLDAKAKPKEVTAVVHSKPFTLRIK